MRRQEQSVQPLSTVEELEAEFQVLTAVVGNRQTQDEPSPVAKSDTENKAEEQSSRPDHEDNGSDSYEVLLLLLFGNLKVYLIVYVYVFYFLNGSSIVHENHQHAEQSLIEGDMVAKKEFTYRSNENGEGSFKPNQSPEASAEDSSSADDDSTSEGTPDVKNDPNYGPSPIGYQFGVERRKQGEVPMLQ